MNYEFTGTLVEKFDAVQKTEKFKSREFVLSKDEQNGSYTNTNTLKFQLSNDRCVLLDNYNIGDDIKVSFNLRGQKVEKDGKTFFFTNLDAWKLHRESAAGFPKDENKAGESAAVIEPEHIPDPDNGDLPF